jgi:hypothetical protein
MTRMPDKTNESPPSQQVRAAEVAKGPREEPRNFASDRSRDDGNDDIGEWMDYPDINTHGSER